MQAQDDKLHLQLPRPIPGVYMPMSAAVTAASESAYQAVDNSLGDGLLQLCAHMGDVCGDMRRNHLQVLLARVAPLRDLPNPSP